MSEIRTNLLKSERGDASPSAPFGLRVSGVTTTSTLTVSGDATISGNLGVAGTITYEDVARVDATGISTFREGYKVGPLAGIALTAYKDGSIRTSGIITATAFVPSQGQLSHRNLIINGAMQISQRATTSTENGYKSLDRYYVQFVGHNEALTHTQHALTSSDTGPWAKGFRNSLHIQNGNQTGGAGAGDYSRIVYNIEAQDIANSGWDYSSATSYLTLSYWVKSSVAQNFDGYIRVPDGTAQGYSFQTGALSANTWTKITKTIPGNANLTFDNNTSSGFAITFSLFMGTDFTDAGNTLNTWAAYASGSRMRNNTSTWYTTNDATFEMTGLQLEVGSVATPFEHRSYADELIRCQRYYQMYRKGSSKSLGLGFGYSANELDMPVSFITPMRDAPIIEQSVSTSGWLQIEGSGIGGGAFVNSNFTIQFATEHGGNIYVDPAASITVGAPYHLVLRNAAAYVAFSSEI